MKIKYILFCFILLSNNTYSKINNIKNSNIFFIDTLYKPISDSIYFTNFYKNRINITDIDKYFHKIKSIDVFEPINVLDSNILNVKINFNSKFNFLFSNYLKEKTFKDSKIIDIKRGKKYSLTHYKKCKKVLEKIYKERKINYYLIGKIHINHNFKSIIYLLNEKIESAYINNTLYLINYNNNGILSIIDLSCYDQTLFGSTLTFSKIKNNINKCILEIFYQTLTSDNLYTDELGNIIENKVPAKVLYKFLLNKNGFFQLINEKK